MRCPNCGAELEQGSIYCEKCGREIQIVPDYDPLDEVIIGREPPQKEYREKEQKPAGEAKAAKEPKKRTPKEEKRRKLIYRSLLIFGCVFLCAGILWGSYYLVTKENNYDYQLRRGIRLVEKERYEEAVASLEKAQSLQAGMEGGDTRSALYLARAYAGLGEGDLAAEYIRDAIFIEESIRGDGYELEKIYLEGVEILNQAGQTEQLGRIIDECSYSWIQKELEPYRIEKPSCDTPEGTYGHYLTLELSAPYGRIYYTLDGTRPTKQSTLYKEPIELLNEGETLLSAVAVNDKGVVSEELVLVYKLEFHGEQDEEEEEEGW